MADAIKLYLNLGTPQGSLVKGLSDATPFVLGPFYQGSALNLRIYPVVPTGTGIVAPFFSQLAIDSLDIQVAVGPRAGAESILANQYTWSRQTAFDSENDRRYFYASLDLNTTNLNAAVGTSDSYQTYFEILLSRGSTFVAVFNTAITINAVVKDPAGAASAPTPAASYYTASQIDALFVRWNNALFSANAGRNIVLLSPSGTRTRELGVGDSAEAIDNAS